MTALCFVDDFRQAVREMLRVTRKRFAIGLLNRRSLLYLQKGSHGGSGAYRGAHWHSASEVRSLIAGLPLADIALRSAVYLPHASGMARAAGRVIPSRLLIGAFFVAVGCVGPRPK